MGAVRQWVACKFGRHFWVEYEPEGDADDTFVYCFWCGAE